MNNIDRVEQPEWKKKMDVDVVFVLLVLFSVFLLLLLFPVLSVCLSWGFLFFGSED